MDQAAEDLYGLPLEEFTKARDALARSTAKEQGKEAGAAIKALKKPSVAAWALNQLARRHPEDVSQLLEAGARLRRAQTATLEGGDPAELREATRAEAAEVTAAAGLARSILAEAGRPGSDAQLDRMVSTLRAAAVDPVGGEQLRRGVLTADLNPAGFGFGTGTDDLDLEAALAASTKAPPRRSRQEAKARREEERLRTRAEAEAAERAARHREWKAEVDKARAHADRLVAKADEAAARARDAQAAADEALARLEALEEEEPDQARRRDRPT